MKVLAKFDRLSESALGGDLFEKLLAIVPESVNRVPAGRVLNLQLAIDDIRYDRLTAVLEAAGFVPWVNHFRPRKQQSEYNLYLIRNYEPTDLTAANLFVCSPLQDDTFQYTRNVSERGGYRIGLDNIFDHTIDFFLQKDVIGLAASSDSFLVSSEVRYALESYGFDHLVFSAVELSVTKYSGEEVVPLHNKHWWSLASDITMPPLNPGNLFNENGEPYDGNPGKGCFPRDGLYVPAELHYHARDVQSLPPFGLALTREGFGVKGHMKYLVASKDFYEFCVRQNIKLNWTPVRIDG